MAEEQGWQPVRIAPLWKWCSPLRTTEQGKAQVKDHLGEIIFVRDTGEFRYCGCKKLEVRHDIAEVYYEERNEEAPDTRIIVSECQILAD